MSNAAEDHNILAPQLLKRIVLSCDSPAEILVLTESLLLGVVLYLARKDQRRASGYLDALHQTVSERIATTPPKGSNHE